MDIAQYRDGTLQIPPIFFLIKNMAISHAYVISGKLNSNFVNVIFVKEPNERHN